MAAAIRSLARVAVRRSAVAPLRLLRRWTKASAATTAVSVSVSSVAGFVFIATAPPAPPAAAPAQSPLADSRRTFRVAIIGSSVALGPKPSAGYAGWAQHLSTALVERYSTADRTVSVRNFARSAATAESTYEQLTSPDLVSSKPHVIIVGLALGNEGLPDAQTEADAIAVADRFDAGCRRLIDTATAKSQSHAAADSPIVCFGGMYPHDSYTAIHYPQLHSFDARLRRTPRVAAVFDFLSATDDGVGHWRPELRADAAHPNAAGHRAMFQAIDIAQVFDPAIARFDRSTDL